MIDSTNIAKPMSREEAEHWLNHFSEEIQNGCTDEFVMCQALVSEIHMLLDYGWKLSNIVIAHTDKGEVVDELIMVGSSNMDIPNSWLLHDKIKAEKPDEIVIAKYPMR